MTMRAILVALSSVFMMFAIAFGLMQFETMGRAEAQPAVVTLGSADAGSGSGSGSAVTAPVATPPVAAPTVPPVAVLDPENPTGVAGTIYSFVREGKYLPAVGAFLVLVVWFLRSYVLGWVAWFKTTLGGYVMTFGTSMLLYFGSALAASVAFSIGLLLKALGAGLAAAGGWEVIKDLLSAKRKAASA